MSEKTIIEKRKKSYKDAEKKFKRIDELKNSFTALNSVISPNKKNVSYTKDQMIRLHDEYLKTIKAVSDRMKQVSDRIKNEFSNDNLTARQRSERDKLSAEYTYMGKLRKTLSKDIKAVNAYNKQEKLPTSDQLYENSRALHREYDLSRAKKYGGGISVRYRMKIKDEKNKLVDGFFTISHKGQTHKAALRDFQDELTKKYGNQIGYFFVTKGETLIDILMKNEQYRKNMLFKKNMMYLKGLDNVDVSLVQMKLREIVKKTKDISRQELTDCNDAIRDLLKTPEKYKMFVEYMNGYAKLDNAETINMCLGIDETSKLDKRNSAMSMVADLLGFGKLVAGSRNLHVKDPKTGKILSGTFMENADGLDLKSTDPKVMDKFANLTLNNIEGVHSLTKDLANLQIIDFICGNADRHLANMLYKFDANGNLIGVVGIDNDSSLGKGDHTRFLSGISMDNLSVITKEMADAVEKMNAEELKVMLYGYDLNTNEVDNAINRLNALKQKIQKDREFYKDVPFGTVMDGHIKVVTDDEIGMISMTGELGSGTIKKTGKYTQGNKNKNLFGAVTALAKGFGAEQCISNIKSEVYENCADIINAGIETFAKTVQDMDASNNKTYNGTQAFTDIRDAIKEYADFVRINGNMIANEDRLGHIVINENNYHEMKDKLNTALTRCNSYVGGKNTEKILKKSKTSNSYTRLKLAMDTKKVIEETLKKIDNMAQKAGMIPEYETKRDEVADRSVEQARKIMEMVDKKNIEAANEIVRMANETNNNRNDRDVNIGQKDKNNNGINNMKRPKAL